MDDIEFSYIEFVARCGNCGRILDPEQPIAIHERKYPRAILRESIKPAHCPYCGANFIRIKVPKIEHRIEGEQ